MAMRQRRWLSMVDDMLRQAQEIDTRLTPGQMHMAVCAALEGREPLVLAAELIGLAIDPKSKVEIGSQECARLLTAIHDRLYEAEMKQRARRNAADDNQFQLEFSWAQERATV